MSQVALTINEVADQLRVGRTTVYRLVRSGELPSFRIGRSRRISLDSLQAYVEGLAS
jgi:excisionase family DNA binding protein